MQPYDVRIKLWNGKRLLLDVSNRGLLSATVEVDACRSRIAKGDATHFDIFPLNRYGDRIIEQLEK